MFVEPGELGSVQEEQQETERVILHSSPSTSAVMCVCAYTTHHYTHNCGRYKTKQSWHPTKNCEDEYAHHAGHKGILGEFGGDFCSPCECLLCGHNGLLRLC